MSSTRYREIVVHGAPRDLGRQIGEAARDEIQGFCEIALQRVNKTVRISRETAYETARLSLPIAEQYSPDMVEELRGTAEAAGVDVLDLMLLQIRNQLQPEADAGCTSFCVAPAEQPENCVVGQNWDNDPALDAFTVVLTRRPQGKPALTTVTQAGLISYIGFNDAGLGACLNTLPAPSRRLGTPHYFTLRGLYEADSLEGAIDAIRRTERAIPANIMLATPQGPADLEVTIDDVHALTNPVRLTHTNHCLHDELISINDGFPELIQSHPRKHRIDNLLSSTTTEMDVLKDALRDHQDHPRSICRHQNDDPETGFWTTVLSVIISPAERRMHVSRGTPCDHPYETYEMPPA